MESSTANTPIYDPYAILPFAAYRSPDCPEGDLCYSLMHFIESEKFRGVDDCYRRFLLQQEAPEDFLLETGAIDQDNVRADWVEQRFGLIRAGMWMQLVQNQDALRNSLLQPGCSTGVPLIDKVAADIFSRLVAANESDNALRRVVLAGDLGISSANVFRTFDHLFQSRLPDEIYISDEVGLADLVNQYALTRYIPVRVFPCGGDADACAHQMLEKGTHVFTISRGEESDSGLANRLLALAAEQKKVSHRFSWNE
ncbi:hypothetical protein H8F21_15235 [Pseudomonas sp. P66]|uniref:Uncharacterized protein n=1 Tax=Pseudomonas arcuscaelestis TaxID=2710591 RepID=A0ABS2BZA4_9PSED|nr:hypothetical protein [Pseudomonas arcuscaelestis]MBM5458919.1 hypothetical protein [Pseudomonas arcuscaelestis]